MFATFNANAFFLAVAVVVTLAVRHADRTHICQSLHCCMAGLALIEAHAEFVCLVAVHAVIETLYVIVAPHILLASIFVTALSVSAKERRASREVVNVLEGDRRIHFVRGLYPPTGYSCWSWTRVLMAADTQIGVLVLAVHHLATGEGDVGDLVASVLGEIVMAGIALKAIAGGFVVDAGNECVT